MKKLLVVSFAILFSFGFTLSGDNNTGFTSECPYINKIQSIDSNNSCPFLKNQVSKENNKNDEKSVCPYKGKMEKEASECPYLKNKGNMKSSEVRPAKFIKLKAS